MIPRIVSQTWKSLELPGEFRTYHQSWRKQNPDFQIRLYDDAACEELVAQTFPEYLDLYHSFPLPIMRADFFRYAVVYRDGGVYADIDMNCLKPMDAILDLGPAVFSVEARISRPWQREARYEFPYQIANCIFAAEPQHPVLRATVDRIAALTREAVPINNATLQDITGPRMLTRLIYDLKPADIGITRQIFLMPPLHYMPFAVLRRNVMACHYFRGSWRGREQKDGLWRRWILRDRLVNPFPGSMMLLRPGRSYEKAFWPG